MDKEVKLPEGWTFKKLGDICLPKEGLRRGPFGSAIRKDFFVAKGYKVYEQANAIYNDVKRGGYFITEDKYKELINFNVVPGDLIVSCAGTMGRIAEIPAKAQPGIINQALLRVRLIESLVDKRYFLHFFRSASFQKKISDQSQGTAITNLIGIKDFKEVLLAVPPIEEQRLIINIIEELFDELDKGIESLRTAQQQLRIYRQAVLKSAFEGRLTNHNLQDGELPNGWSWAKIVNLASKEKHSIKAGPFGSSLKKEFYVSQGHKIYGQEQVISGDAAYGDYYISDTKYKELITNKVQPNDILISLVGTVGKVLILPDSCESGIINPRLIKITLDTQKYLPRFFKYYFESSTVKSYYSSKAQGTTMDVLNLGIIKTIPFPLCSLAEQAEIIREIESRLSVCDNIEETINVSLRQSEALRQSILKKAFEGKLMATAIAHEPKIVSISTKRSDWDRKALAGKIIYACHKDKSFGITKFQKTLYLCEQHAQLDFDTNYLKQAAGPLDASFIYPFVREAEKKSWFTERKDKPPYYFEPSSGISTLVDDYSQAFRIEQDTRVKFVIGLLKNKNTDESELIATIYAIWNNYLIQGAPLESDGLVNEVYSWSESKAKFKRSNILNTWAWMQEKGLIPVGFGSLINKKTT